MQRKIHPAPKAYRYKRIVQAKLFIDAHFSLSINLDDIAGEACFSKFHFIRLFRSAYGKTPHQYLTWVRIAKARELLAAGMPVEETCYRLGFDSPGSFTELFKRYTRQSPQTYQRARKLREKALIERPLQFVPNCFAAQMV